MNYKDAVIEAALEGMQGMPEELLSAFIPMLDLVYTVGYNEALRNEEQLNEA